MMFESSKRGNMSQASAVDESTVPSAATNGTGPPARGRTVKVRYATQARVAPPELVLFTTGQLTPSYRRYLEKDLRRTFGFQGTPLRLVVRVRTGERGAPG